MTDLAGAHALVTGGATGIGAAIARALFQAGARISIAGRRSPPLDALAVELPGVAAVVADVTREADVQAMVAAARLAHGPIDILVANAGAAESAAFARIDRAHWSRMLDVNLTGAFLSAQAALADVLRAQGTPPTPRRIVFVASTAGLKGYPYVAAYAAAKHGVIGLMRSMAAEFASRDVTVNAVCPGFTQTPLLETSIANIVAKTGRTRAAAMAELARGNPQGRFVRPEEVADAVRWLCAPGAASVTGQAIAVSGGET